MTDEELSVEFGRLLRELRGHAELTQEALAIESGISRASIVNIENGRQGVSLGTLYRLATALGLEPQLLLPRAASNTLPPKIAIGPNTPDTKRAALAMMRRAQQEDAS